MSDPDDTEKILLLWQSIRGRAIHFLKRIPENLCALSVSLRDGVWDEGEWGIGWADMKTLIIADVHGNWPALEAVHRAEPDFDVCLVLGDLCDFAVGLREVIAWVREHADVVVRGNHDHAVAQYIRPQQPVGSPLKQLRNETRQQHWEQMTAGERDFLAELPIRVEWNLDGWKTLLLHATPRDPLNEYLGCEPELWRLQWEGIHCDLLGVGHTHLPFVCELGEARVLNPGSVGQPRDGDWRASYAVVMEGQIELRRVEYDVDRTLNDLRRAGMSEAACQTAETVLRSGKVK